MQAKLNTLIFYGPTGNGLPPEKLGGGERGCQRTMAIYANLGVQVIVIEKPNLGRGKIAFLKSFLITPFFFIRQLVRHPKSPVHIVGFYENQLYYEFLIFSLSKLFGRKVTYELRNGTMVKTISKHSRLYQMAMRSIVEHSVVVLCQGKEYVDYIQTHWKARTIYYPNYVMSNIIRLYNEREA